MNRTPEQMIDILAPEIDRKCAEIKQVRKEKLFSRLFVLLCAAILIIPTTFVFLGISLMALIIPVVFIATAFLILSPILINQQGGYTYEQA